jgi:hypothetical protein
MNERYNRIAGCQMAVDAARAEMDRAAQELANEVVFKEDKYSELVVNSKAYRLAQEAYADALDQLADALRR